MTATAANRGVIAAWMSTHTNVYAAKDGDVCVHAVWMGTEYLGCCGRPAEWVVDYSHRVRSLGSRPHCEDHTVSVLSKWLSFENGEIPA